MIVAEMKAITGIGQNTVDLSDSKARALDYAHMEQYRRSKSD